MEVQKVSSMKTLINASSVLVISAVSVSSYASNEIEHSHAHIQTGTSEGWAGAGGGGVHLSLELCLNGGT